MTSFDYEDLESAISTLEEAERLLSSTTSPRFVAMLNLMAATSPEAAWITEQLHGVSQYLFDLISALEDTVEQVSPAIEDVGGPDMGQKAAETALYGYIEAQASVGNAAAADYLAKWPRPA